MMSCFGVKVMVIVGLRFFFFSIVFFNYFLNFRVSAREFSKMIFEKKKMEDN